MRLQEITAISEPSTLKSRHNYQTCVHHIGGNREMYDGYNILEPVILRHHLYARDLQNVIKSPGLQEILKTIVEKNPSVDIYTSWRKYCRTMDPEERAAPTFEGAIYLSAESILDSKDRERWVSSCQELLSSLKSLARRDQRPAWQAASTNKVTKRKSYRSTQKNGHKPTDLVQRPGSPFEQLTDPGEFNATEVVGLSPSAMTEGSFSPTSSSNNAMVATEEHSVQDIHSAATLAMDNDYRTHTDEICPMVIPSALDISQPPANREDFHVAIICAMPYEANSVTLLFDHFWDEDGDPYGQAAGDAKTYITGRIGNHNVVLVVLPAFLVGVCGAVPQIADQDALLGDVVVSSTIVHYGHYEHNPTHLGDQSTDSDNLKSANSEVRGLFTTLATELMRNRLQMQSEKHLTHLQKAANTGQWRADYLYPGRNEDILYLPAYGHKHQASCHLCVGESERQQHARGLRYKPNIFFGKIGSSIRIMECGMKRDRISDHYKLIAFETEAARLYEKIPCIVVKGICAYGDRHKQKRWQDFAAATAASVMRAMLGRYVP